MYNYSASMTAKYQHFVNRLFRTNAIPGQKNLITFIVNHWIRQLHQKHLHNLPRPVKFHSSSGSLLLSNINTFLFFLGRGLISNFELSFGKFPFSSRLLHISKLLGQIDKLSACNSLKNSSSSRRISFEICPTL